MWTGSRIILAVLLLGSPALADGLPFGGVHGASPGGGPAGSISTGRGPGGLLGSGSSTGWVLTADAIKAALDINCRTGYGYVSPTVTNPAALLTVTRASTGYVNDSGGNYTSAATNALRRSDLGCLIEPASTNKIRNNSMQGAVPGSPGTLPTNWATDFSTSVYSVIGTGTENGIDYIDIQINGTVSGSNYIWFDAIGADAIPASTGFAASMFHRLVGGTLTNISQMFIAGWEYNGSAGLSITGGGTITAPTGAALTTQRYTYSATSGASTASIRTGLQINWAASAAVNFTLRLGWPQLEQNSFATSPIRTTNTTVTRAADIVKVTTPPALGASASMFAQGVVCTGASGQPAYMSYDDGSANNRMMLTAQPSTPSLPVVVTIGGSGYSFSAGTFLTTRNKIALGIAANSQAAVANGGGIVTSSNTNGTPAVNLLWIGSHPAGAFQFCGFIERVALWPSNRISNLGLQGLTQ